VPVDTKVTTPVLESTVQTPVVLLEYVLVPEPAVGVEVMVGAVARMLYVETYDPPSIDSVRDAAVMAKEMLGDVAAA
jgi:hypothetical protein